TPPFHFCTNIQHPGPGQPSAHRPVDRRTSGRHPAPMSDPTRPYRQLAQNNLLANRRLHLATAALQPGEWRAPRSGFFPSLCATLNHIACVDLFYIDAAEGGTLGYAAFASDIPYPDPATLALAQTALDHRALALCAALTPDRLSQPVHIHRAARIQTETLADTLMHLFLHSQHHRGQAHAMLSGTSVAPPQLDEFFMADDANSRAADLAALDWDESMFRFGAL
ncbi:MAG: DinB family protein, partial [Paracoccaceae bacterium]